MTIDLCQARLTPEHAHFSRIFDRIPIALSHNLGELTLFRPERLKVLAEQYDRYPQDYFVAVGAPSPATKFYSVRHGHSLPSQALCRLDRDEGRVLLKRPENHDPAFRDLLHMLFGQLCEICTDISPANIRRLESAVFISSANTITPFHFDPEIAFFMQIEGEKVYHVYSPEVLTERDLERFYVGGIVNIGQVQLSGRQSIHEHVFRLGPGKGLHQPQNAPHWVETRGARSISYSFILETDRGQSLGRTRAFNHYLRKLGLGPAQPGLNPAMDALKAKAMRTAIPMREAARQMLKGIRP